VNVINHTALQSRRCLRPVKNKNKNTGKGTVKEQSIIISLRWSILFLTHNADIYSILEIICTVVPAIHTEQIKLIYVQNK